MQKKVTFFLSFIKGIHLTLGLLFQDLQLMTKYNIKTPLLGVANIQNLSIAVFKVVLLDD